jgi:hypothetical protein
MSLDPRAKNCVTLHSSLPIGTDIAGMRHDGARNKRSAQWLEGLRWAVTNRNATLTPMLVHLLPMLQSGAYDSSNDAAAGAVGAVVALVVGVFYLAFFVLTIAGMWKVFAKAGKPGWAAIVPVYNIIVLLEIIGRPVWWIILLLIPCVNFVIWILLGIDLAKSFGKGTGFGIGLGFIPTWFIFYPLLGFGSAKYQGPSVAPAA